MRSRHLAVLLLAAACGGTTTGAVGPVAPVPAAPRLAGLGELHRAVTTRSPEAQAFFDQGLRLTFAFNYEEALRSYSEAARLDPSCALCEWGVALAQGPDLNNPDRQSVAARQAALRAKELAQAAPPVERALTEALVARFADPPPDDRTALNAAYAEAMRQVARRYPEDADVQTLYVDAVMATVPIWEGSWKPDGAPAFPATTEALEALERALARAPQHPGLNHYYIHLVEGSPQHRLRAVDSAERLMTAMPGAGHMLHMPSHIFMRIGRFAEAEEANRRAIAADNEYLAKWNPGGRYPMLAGHNRAVLWSILLVRGESREAVELARAIAAELDAMASHMPPPIVPLVRSSAAHFVPLTLTRFGRWDEVLALPAPPADLAPAVAVDAWARGLALVARGDLEQAAARQKQIAEALTKVPPEPPLGLVRPLIEIQGEQLAGAIAARRGRGDEARAHLEKAVALEDGLDPNSEPPMWNAPSRLRLGALLLAAGKAADAESVYRKHLERVPGDPWALFGLTQALAARHAPDVEETRRAFAKGWEKADVKLQSTVF